MDDLLASADENGNAYSEEMLLTSIMGGYFAGMDTVASTASFMLYAVLKQPGLLERVRAKLIPFLTKRFTAEALRQIPFAPCSDGNAPYVPGCALFSAHRR